LKKFLTVLFVIVFFLSLKALAKDAFSFEDKEYAKKYPNPDSIPSDIDAMKPFTTGYRNSLPEDFSRVEGAKTYHGSHAIQLTMTHEGTRWLIFAKNARESTQADALDSTFLHDLDIGDTLFYYLYVPWNAPIDSIFIFVRALDAGGTWTQDVHTVYHASDLHFGRWNELKDGISDTTVTGFGNGEPFPTPLIQSDFQIDTRAGVVPACTLYFDCPSSKGRVPSEYIDTTGQAGIEMPEPGDGAVKVAKGSINCVEYAIGVVAPVMVQVYDLTGRKQLEIPVGIQSAGTYRIPLNLPAGVYLTRVVAGEEEVTGKVICVR